MLRRPAQRFSLVACILAAAASLILFACQDNISTEPEFVRINNRYQVSIKGGTGSAAGGTVVSDRGGISCAVSAGGSVSGKCSQGFKSGANVALTMTPAAGATLGTVEGPCEPLPDTRLTCNLQVTGNVTIVVNFDRQSNSFSLSITGGAAGSGTVGSSPSGINCTITNGSAGTTGCTSAYSLNQQVTLTATAASGSYLKAWAGGGCDTNGTINAGSGSCLVTMSQAVSVVVSFDHPVNVALIGQWSAPVNWPAQAVAIHANLLPNGKVLTWGRTVHQPVLWDPTTGTFGGATEPADLFCSGHTLLPDGRILVAGGHSGVDTKGIVSAQLYDGNTNTWQAAPNMRNGRWYPTNLTLATGEVLTISGGDTSGALNTLPEVWSPGGVNGEGTWRALTSGEASVPYFPMMFVAPNGTAYMAGPNQATGYLNTTGTGSWTAGPNRINGGRDYGSAVMYDAGKILAVGGGSPTATAEVIDLNAGGAAAWRSVGSMRVARRQMNATLLADGAVLATGGSNASGFNNMPTDARVLGAERWNPSTERWDTLARQTHYRLYHSTALLLPDGRVLSVGSGQPAATGLTDDYTGELYSPPYLFKPDGTAAARPTYSGAPDAIGYGANFSVTFSSAAPIAKVTWIRLSTVTHATNMNQRMNYLPFTANGSTLTITAPANANLSPPGHYMLFVVDANGVPSIAKIIRIS
jgi:Domain of unknown function (DUF1929)/Divergent InlB B-repeat domain